ncbi:hypothetical protein [Parafilimonas sp.]|uniref:hypothetical protein n=1 Tax=Parafilimonas sp. TaxID=1969739 RepID=UPI0039E4D8C4
MKKAAEKPVSPKKEFRKELAVKIETALGELKEWMDEEEFKRRLKKAAKVLAQGLHGKELSKHNDAEGKIKQAPPPHHEIKPAFKQAKGLKKAGPKKAMHKKAAKT